MLTISSFSLIFFCIDKNILRYSILFVKIGKNTITQLQNLIPMKHFIAKTFVVGEAGIDLSQSTENYLNWRQTTKCHRICRQIVCHVATSLGMRLLWAGNTLNFFLHDIFLLSVKFVESFVRKSVHHFSSILIALFLWTEKDLGVTMCPKNEMFYTEAMGGGGRDRGRAWAPKKLFQH